MLVIEEGENCMQRFLERVFWFAGIVVWFSTGNTKRRGHASSNASNAWRVVLQKLCEAELGGKHCSENLAIVCGITVQDALPARDSRSGGGSMSTVHSCS